MKQLKFNAMRNFKPSKTWIILGVAITIGGLAALAARSYLSSQMAAIEARAIGKTTTVLVAKSDIAKGDKLSKINVAVRSIPSEFAHSVAVTPAEFDRIDGQALAYPIKSGEMILWGLMETQKVPTFSARVEVGHRAMTVPVDEINSISGMLEPGDHIDLMVNLEQKGKKIIFPLLQGVQIMATGQRSVDDPVSGEKRQYSTVTIDTTLEQAQNVIVARDVGRITALLRNPQDQQISGRVNYDVAAMLGLKEGSKAGNEVPVIYGGAAAKLSQEELQIRPHVAQKDQATAGVENVSGRASGTLDSKAAVRAVAPPKI